MRGQASPSSLRSWLTGLIVTVVVVLNLSSFYWSTTRSQQAQEIQDELRQLQQQLLSAETQVVISRSSASDSSSAAEYSQLLLTHRQLVDDELQILTQSSALFHKIIETLTQNNQQQQPQQVIQPPPPKQLPQLRPVAPQPQVQPQPAASDLPAWDSILDVLPYRPPGSRRLDLPDFPPPPAPDASTFSIDLPASVVDRAIAAIDRTVDGWRDDLHIWATRYVQLRLYQLQNPPAAACKARSSLVVDVDKGCGFGCQLHHTNHCFKKAIHDGRLMSFTGSSWRHAPSSTAGTCRSAPNPPNGWACIFQPITTCPAIGNSPLNCPITESARYGLEYFVPEQLKRLVATFHRDPPVWFAGQTESFLMRPADSYAGEFRNAAVAQLPTNGEVFAALHVRRTDKIGTEAQFHGVTEYINKLHAIMTARLGQLPPAYTLFVLSDEPKVTFELEQYTSSHPSPTITVRTNEDSLASGSTMRRNSFDSLKLLLNDLSIARHAQFFVGTFSSQVSRLVYEMRQIPFADPFEYVGSLDDGWYYG